MLPDKFCKVGRRGKWKAQAWCDTERKGLTVRCKTNQIVRIQRVSVCHEPCSQRALAGPVVTKQQHCAGGKRYRSSVQTEDLRMGQAKGTDQFNAQIA